MPKPGGYVSDFGRLSAVVCAVQLAARGDKVTAQRIWERVNEAESLSDSRPLEDITAQLKDPRLLLARCLFDHGQRRILTEPSNWPQIHVRMKALLEEFPKLREPERVVVVRGLAAASGAKPPMPSSTEALLVAWSRIPGTEYDIFHDLDPNESDALAREIVLRGVESVPGLIALLGDPRVTAHGWLDGGGSPPGIQTLGELAGRLLSGITGIPAMTEGERTDSIAYRFWLDRCRSMGEEEALALAVFGRENGRIARVREYPARILAHKFPERIPALCAQFSKDATPGLEPFELVRAVVVARLPFATRVNTLTEFALRGSLAQKRVVLQNLATIDPSKCAELLHPILQTLPTDTTNSYWTCPEAALAHVVKQVDDDEVWSEFLRAAKRSSVGLRLQMMSWMHYGYHSGEGNRARRLAFLAAFLGDESLRELPPYEKGGRFDGPCAASTFKGIAVQDFAALQIAFIFKFSDHPDDLWTPEQRKELREKVQLKLME